tara:strand:- start:1847 stop:2104 length:258 start_codon:yes stop_codon:yes gene_type:complete
MKIKEEQLSVIKDQQERIKNLVTEIGLMESKKHQLLHGIAVVNQEVEDYKKVLEEEYGAININVDTGEYTKIEKEKEEKLETSDV